MVSIIEDFVNRERYLDILWQALNQNIHKRIILIPGDEGIGKTYLLEEYHAECKQGKIPCVRIDFLESANRTYLGIVHAVRMQLGANGFAHLDNTVRQNLAPSSQEKLLLPPAALDVAHQVDASRSSGERSGGVDFSGPAQIGHDVAGRDIIYLFQIIQREEPQVQEDVQGRITEALRSCLIELASTQSIAFLFDSWELAPTATRDWLSANLFAWALDKELPKGVVIVAGFQVPYVSRLQIRVESLMLTYLSEEAVRIYWVEKRGLSPEEVPHITRLTHGKPSAVAMLADLQAEPAKIPT